MRLITPGSAYIKKYSAIAILNYFKIEILEYWNKYWNIEINIEILEYWNKYWNIEILKYCEILKYWNIEILKHWNIEILKF